MQVVDCSCVNGYEAETGIVVELYILQGVDADLNTRWVRVGLRVDVDLLRLSINKDFCGCYDKMLSHNNFYFLLGRNFGSDNKAFKERLLLSPAKP